MRNWHSSTRNSPSWEGRTNGCGCCGRSLAWDRGRPKWSSPTWINRSDLRTPGRSPPTPAWSRDAINQARWTARGGSTSVGRDCCPARWWRWPGSCSGAIPGRAQYERLCGGQKTRRKKAIVAVARKLLVRCWVMLLRKEPWKEMTPLAEPVRAGHEVGRRSLKKSLRVGFDSDSVLCRGSSENVLIHEFGIPNEPRGLAGIHETTRNRKIPNGTRQASVENSDSRINPKRRANYSKLNQDERQSQPSHGLRLRPAAPGDPSGARLPPPLPRPSGAGKRKESSPRTAAFFPGNIDLGQDRPAVRAPWIRFVHPPLPHTARSPIATYAHCFAIAIGFAIVGRLAAPRLHGPHRIHLRYGQRISPCQAPTMGLLPSSRGNGRITTMLRICSFHLVSPSGFFLSQPPPARATCRQTLWQRGAISICDRFSKSWVLFLRWIVLGLVGTRGVCLDSMFSSLNSCADCFTTPSVALIGSLYQSSNRPSSKYLLESLAL